MVLHTNRKSFESLSKAPSSAKLPRDTLGNIALGAAMLAAVAGFCGLVLLWAA